MSTPNEPTGREPGREEEVTAAEVGAAGRVPEGDDPVAPATDAPATAAPGPDAVADADDQEPDAVEPDPGPDVRQAEPEPVSAPRADRDVAPEAEGTAAAVTGVEKDAAAEARRAAPAETPRPRRGSTRPAGGAPVVRAQARYVRSSARKARLVCDGIRGKSVQEARAILAYSPRQVARDWAKLLESAVANAEHNHELVGDDLRVLTVTADEGPTLKRFRPRAMGRATRIRKRTSHLTITLTPKGQS